MATNQLVTGQKIDDNRLAGTHQAMNGNNQLVTGQEMDGKRLTGMASTCGNGYSW